MYVTCKRTSQHASHDGEGVAQPRKQHIVVEQNQWQELRLVDSSFTYRENLHDLLASSWKFHEQILFR